MLRKLKGSRYNKLQKEKSRKLNNILKKSSARKIQQTYKIHKSNSNKVKLLIKACPDNIECLMLGKYKESTMDLFDGFRTLKYADNYKLLNSGYNGSVFQINFKRKGYDSFGILKIASAIEIGANNFKNMLGNREIIFNQDLFKTSDNVIYEYLVGLKINEYCKILPNFLETYQLYKFNDLNTYKDFVYDSYLDSNNKNYKTKHNEKHITSTLRSNLQEQSIMLDDTSLLKLLNDSCSSNTFDIPYLKQSYTYALMIQYIKKSITLDSIMVEDMNFNKNELIYVLFQIYFSLYQLYNEFIHYDLHADNIMLYQPYPNGYIEYIYHINGEIITFKSKYIAKIIDYGRCYVKDATSNILNILKKGHNCNREMSSLSGYSISNKALKIEFGIDYISPNVSYDLKLLNNIYLYQDSYLFDTDATSYNILMSILKQVNYGKGIKSKDKTGGTKSLNENGYNYGSLEDISIKSQINNVSDAFIALYEAVLLMNNENTSKKMAEIHIYDTNQPYEFIEL
jgi:hypothetical protein